MKLSPLALLVCAFAISLAACAKSAGVKTETGTLQVKLIARGLDHPWGMVFLPDGSMLVTERSGALRRVSMAGQFGEPVSGMPAVHAQGQGGLLDVVLAPDFARSGKIYFSYAEINGKKSSTAVSYGVLTGNTLTQLTRIFTQQPQVESNGHFGSRLVWAPDGKLFVTLGDRYKYRDNAQTLDNHHGKVIRINADGSVPQDNPFVNVPAALPEIWSYGHRNMQGAAIHPVSHELWTGEHGPQGGDELNVDRAGNNYGWPVITYGRNYGGGKIGEGTHRPGMEQPLYRWVPSIATAGFIFYTGERFPQWKNNILLASLREQTLVRLVIEGNNIVHEERMLTREIGQRLRHVVQGPDGLVYLLTDEDDGRIYQLSPQ